MLVRRARMAQIVSISHTLQKQHPSHVPNKTLSSPNYVIAQMALLEMHQIMIICVCGNPCISQGPARQFVPLIKEVSCGSDSQNHITKALCVLAVVYDVKKGAK